MRGKKIIARSIYSSEDVKDNFAKPPKNVTIKYLPQRKLNS
jgi:hypothetical protein